MGIYKEIMPGKITVGGVEYPAIYNFEALAIMEDEIGEHYTKIPTMIINGGMSARETAKTISALVRAADGSLTAKEVLKRTKISEINLLALQAFEVMANGTPDEAEEEPKNAVT